MLKTHQAAGGLAAAGYLYLTHEPFLSVVGVVGLCAGYMAAPLPDVDSPNSVPARTLAPIAWALEAARIRHRTLTHTVWVLGALFWLVQMAAHSRVGNVPLYPILMAAWVGVASHPLVDMLTVDGVPLFWPLLAKQNFRVSRFRTSGPWDNVFHGLFIFLMIALVLWWGVQTVPFLHALFYHGQALVHRVDRGVPGAVRDYVGRLHK